LFRKPGEAWAAQTERKRRRGVMTTFSRDSQRREANVQRAGVSSQLET
jgi:hypothetical protein